MKVKTVTVSEKGQIAIPVEIRQNMGLSKGSTVILIQKGEKILIEKAEAITKEVEDNFKDLLNLSELSLKDIWDGKEEDVWDQYLEAK